MMRKKKGPKIQQKEGFLSLCKHSTVRIETQEYSATIKTHPTNTKISHEA
jgi:hypothetical protein